MMSTANKVTIVVPVYADWPSLEDCIESLKHYVDPDNKVLLVNDCGPEVELMEKKIKTAITGLKNFEYYRNPKNLGFVKTCNRAVLELDKTDNDVLLLNSDTKVTEGFLEEMLSVLENNNKIAVISPRSNNATLATMPLWAASDKGIKPEQSYKIYQAIRSHLPSYYITPVAHGFCMLIRRPLVKKYGLFDEIFGKGYGEEVDFCLRLAAHGYKSAIANYAYVFHLEARSFTLEAKAKMLEENNKIVWQRYPSYRQSVRDYMKKTILAERQIETSLGIKIGQKNKLHRLTKVLHRKLIP